MQETRDVYGDLHREAFRTAAETHEQADRKLLAKMNDRLMELEEQGHTLVRRKIKKTRKQKKANIFNSRKANK